MAIRRVIPLDATTDRPLPDEPHWFADCEITSDEMEVGYECGKGHCICYKPKEKGATR